MVDDDGFVLNFGVWEEELEVIKIVVGVIDRSDWGFICLSGSGASRAFIVIVVNYDGLVFMLVGSGFEIKVVLMNDIV